MPGRDSSRRGDWGRCSTARAGQRLDGRAQGGKRAHKVTGFSVGVGRAVLDAGGRRLVHLAQVGGQRARSGAPARSCSGRSCVRSLRELAGELGISRLQPCDQRRGVSRSRANTRERPRSRSDGGTGPPPPPRSGSNRSVVGRSCGGASYQPCQQGTRSAVSCPIRKVCKSSVRTLDSKGALLSGYGHEHRSHRPPRRRIRQGQHLRASGERPVA